MPTVVKRVLLAVLIVVVVLTGLPLAMGMGGMPSCPECSPSVQARVADCLPAAMLVVAVGLTLACAGRLRRIDRRPSFSGFGATLERPPRTA